MSRQPRPITDREIKAWLAAGAVVRGVGEGLTCVASTIAAQAGKASWILLLGDRVLQSLAWKLADQLGWPDTFVAEYIALTQLQADAFVCMDPALARAVASASTASTTCLHPMPSCARWLFRTKCHNGRSRQPRRQSPPTAK